jgi:type I restriction enzyme, S subunit
VGLRPGYKRTEIGTIPEDWDAPRLGELFTFRNGLNKAKRFFGHGTPIVNYMDVYTNRGLFAHDLKGRVSLTKQERAAFDVRQGDVFFTRTSETAEEVGLTSVMLDNCKDTVFSGFVLRARPKDCSFDDQFKKYCFSTDSVRKQITSQSSETTRALTNGRALSQVVIARPGKREQQLIAETLTETDDLIRSLEQLVAKKHQLKQGALQVLLRPMPTDDLRPLGEVSSLKGRIGWQGLKQAEFTTNGDEPFLITGMNFKDGAIRWDEVYHISEDRFQMAPEIQLRSKDVLMTKDGTIGKVLYIDSIPHPGRASINSHLLLFRPRGDSYNTRYLYYQLSSRRFRTYVEMAKSGTTFFGLSQTAVAAYPMLLPPISEQNRIAAILTNMDADISALESRVTKAQQVRKGMIHDLLTGRIRLA